MHKLSVIVFPLFAACAINANSTGVSTFTSTNAPARPLRARAFDSVEIYTSSPPPRAYTEVGLIRSEGYDAGVAVNEMRNRAADVGCDGVIVTSTGMNPYSRIVYNGACFLYADDTTWRPPSTAPSDASRAATPAPARARDPRCNALLAEVRAAPNDAKAAAAQRVPSECFASSRTTSPGS